MNLVINKNTFENNVQQSSGRERDLKDCETHREEKVLPGQAKRIGNTDYNIKTN